MALEEREMDRAPPPVEDWHDVNEEGCVVDAPLMVSDCTSEDSTASMTAPALPVSESLSNEDASMAALAVSVMERIEWVRGALFGVDDSTVTRVKWMEPADTVKTGQEGTAVAVMEKRREVKVVVAEVVTKTPEGEGTSDGLNAVTVLEGRASSSPIPPHTLTSESNVVSSTSVVCVPASMLTVVADGKLRSARWMVAQGRTSLPQ